MAEYFQFLILPFSHRYLSQPKCKKKLIIYDAWTKPEIKKAETLTNQLLRLLFGKGGLLAIARDPEGGSFKTIPSLHSSII